MDGSISMLTGDDSDHQALFLTNFHGEKLLKLVVKNEVAARPHTPATGTNGCDQDQYAQIKIVRYHVNHAVIWNDRPDDPQRIRLRRNVELTYHGSANSDRTSKVHIKAANRYVTLIDDTLTLPRDAEIPLPLFSFETGHANGYTAKYPVTKKSCHKLSSGHPGPVRFDISITSADADMQAFFTSMYGMSLLWNQDYLIAQKNLPITSGRAIAPIWLFRMRGYRLMVRRSLSNHQTLPYLQFHNNKHFYEKLMSRKTAIIDASGNAHWSTMAEEDARIKQTQKKRSDR